MKEEITKIIASTKEDEKYRCKFWITSPKREINSFQLIKNPAIIKVLDMFIRNRVSTKVVDTVPGSFNLNRDWIETDMIICTTAWSGVYPLDWNIDDVVEFAEMEDNGDIIVQVAWYNEYDEFVALNH